MPTLQEVKEQVKALGGFSSFLARREIKELPNILWEDEVIERIVQGMYNLSNGVLVGTNKRLIFIDSGLIHLIVEDFAYDKITSIQYELGSTLGGKIFIVVSGNRAEFKHIVKKQAYDFVVGVHAKLSTYANSASQRSSSQVISQLERLAKLKVSGILTEEEFNAQKRRILETS